MALGMSVFVLRILDLVQLDSRAQTCAQLDLLDLLDVGEACDHSEIRPYGDDARK